MPMDARRGSLTTMTTLTNDDDRRFSRSSTAGDDLAHKVFAHWDQAVHEKLGATVPLPIVGHAAPVNPRDA